MRVVHRRASDTKIEETSKAMSVAAKRVTPHDTSVASNVVAMPRRRAPIGSSSGGQESDPSADAHLLARIAAREAPAFAELMQRHLSAVLSTARRIVRDDAEAEDIAQEAFLRLWNGAQTLEAGAHGVRPWLRRVASNLAIDWLRKAKRMDVTDEVPEQTEEPRQMHALDVSETAVRVDRALMDLPPRQRVAVSLFHFDELSQREVAEMMELSEDALESLLARGRRKLRAILKDDWQELLDSSNDAT